MSDQKNETLVHATSIVLGETVKPFGGPQEGAVLLLGESGSGKSDVALRMIVHGAALLSDDQTALFVKDGKIFGRAPERIAGLMEIRGVGIANVPASCAEAPILLAVFLSEKVLVARMPEPAYFKTPENLAESERIPLLILKPFEASTPAKIAAAAANAALGKLFLSTP